MIRVLQVVNIMDRAGIETMLMNYYRVLDKTKVQFDFLTHRPVQGAYDEEIRALGGKIYYAPRLYPQNYKEYFGYMHKFFEEHGEYEIVHSHIDAMSYLPLLAAKKAGIPVRIAHSHSTAIDFDFKWLLKQLFRKKIVKVATNYAACSLEAGRYLFGKKDVKIIYNALNIEKYGYNVQVRDKKRKELNLDGKYVIGHVGRFTKAKNHMFILNVFNKLAEKDQSYFLLLIGKGELMGEVQNYIRAKKLQNRVLILSDRDDVCQLYQAMDLFVFPSKYEGLGMGAVEAQISGLKTIVSDQVPKEVKVSDELEVLKLDENLWIEKIFHTQLEQRKTKYCENYDVKKTVMDLKKYYESLLEKLEK